MKTDLTNPLYGGEMLTGSLRGTVSEPLGNDDLLSFEAFAAASAPARRSAEATLIGAASNDSLTGMPDDDRLVGRGGSDTLKGLGGDDNLIGGAGDDRLIGGGGADTLKGGGGADNLKGGGGNDRLIGGGGNDRLGGGGGDDFLKGGGGDDNLRGGGGADNLKGGNGADTLKGNGGEDRLRGGGGDDSLNGGGADDIIEGGFGSDRMRGGAGEDMFVFRSSEFSGGAVDRIVDFRAGTDRIDLTAVAGAGTFGSIDFGRLGGAVTIEIGTGRVILEGVTSEAALDADDFVLSGIVDTVPGGGGDTMPGGGDDTMPGGGGDTMPGGGDDTMPGGGDDTMPGGGGDDTMPPEDQVTGTDDADLLRGEGPGDEIILGLGGRDTIETGAGTDTLTGGTDADLFLVKLVGGQVDANVDTVSDFNYLGGDQIGLGEALSGIAFARLQDVVRATPTGGDTLIAIDIGAGFQTVLRLEGVTFTTEQLIPYGFDAPAPGSAAFSAEPYGFTNDSNNSVDPAATRDGRYVAFVDKDDLDFNPGDFNLLDVVDEFDQELATMDVFVRNMLTGEVQRVNADADGVIAKTAGGFDSKSMSPAISEDGRFVAYATDGQAAAADTNGEGDIYVRDLLADTDPVLVSVAADGSAGGGVPLGRDDFTSSVSVVDISADGQRIAFVSTADLTSAGANDTNGTADIYLRDLVAGTTELVSVGTTAAMAGGGVITPYTTEFGGLSAGVVELSADGRYVAYLTDDGHVAGDTDDEQDLYLRDTVGGRSLNITGIDPEEITGFSMSADGSRIAFSTAGALVGADTNGKQDVYIADIDLDTFTVSDLFRVSVAEGGFQVFGGDAVAPVLSPDGTRVAFQSDAFDIIPIDIGQQSSSGQNYRLFDLEIATGEYSTTSAFYELDKANEDAGNLAYTYTDDRLVYRTAVEVEFPSSDSLVVEETERVDIADLAPDNNESDAFSGIQLDANQRFYRSEINDIGADPFIDGDLKDRDVFALRTFQTEEYRIRVEGSANGDDPSAGTLFDPVIRVREIGPDGTTFLDNDDIDFATGNRSSEIIFTAEADTSYALEVVSFDSELFGTYLIDFAETDDLDPGDFML